MSILTGYFPLERFGLEYDYELSRELRERQRQEEERAMEVFKNKLVYGKSECLLEDVRIELIERGMNADNLNHVRNTMADVLSLSFNGGSMELRQALFPKRHHTQSISINIQPYSIYCSIEPTATPASVAEFILAVVGWIPEYDRIEEKLKAQIKQEQMACQISLDLFKRVVGEVLEQKGYEYKIRYNLFVSKASISINVSEAFSITMEVNLQQDFLTQVTRYVNSLPEFTKQSSPSDGEDGLSEKM